MPTITGGTTRPVKKSNNKKRVQKKQTPFGSSCMYKGAKKRKLIALDTNILMTDPLAMFHFNGKDPKDDDNDIFIPLKVLLELDRKKVPKKGGDEKQTRNARTAAKMLLYLTESVPMSQIKNGIPLIKPGEKIPNGRSRKHFKAKLFFEMPKENELEKFLDPDNSDHEILRSCLKKRKEDAVLPEGKSHDFLLVSFDNIMRIVGLLVGLRVETYLNETPSEESFRSKGVHYFPLELLRRQKTEDGEMPHPIPQQDGKREYVFKGKEFENVVMYEFLIFGRPLDSETRRQLEPETERQYIVLEKVNAQTVHVRELKDYQYQEKVFYVHAMNAEQNCLVNAILDYRTPLVIAEGGAGTGKTFITLACAYQQIKNGVHKIVQVSRDAVESGESIGFLPGSVESKIKNFLPGVLGGRDTLLRLLSKDIKEKKKFCANEKKVAEEDTLAVDIKTLPKSKRRQYRRDRVATKKAGQQVKGGGYVSDEIARLEALWVHLQGEGTSFESVSLLRGANISNIALIDEAQHTKTNQGKMLGSRVQEGGQLVLTGNVEQDDVGISFRDSGVAKLIDATRGTDLMNLITLRTVERGRLAARIAQYYGK
ncbi:MAG: hypothetical protein UU98_C0007G0033 [Parcubacteria group bacterium GW2011_GWD2_42_14]|nr:MAG: hypothetical protein UU98_C0007G0033 [Parcubacteria group bacterium GW2011_GWD2_42_14]